MKRTAREDELRKIQLESILISSGSNASLKNQSNTAIVPNKDNIASSLIFKSLTKDRINEDSLAKAVNITISELKPTIPLPPTEELVPKTLLDEQLVIADELTNQITDLNTMVSDMDSQIQNLKADLDAKGNEALGTEQTNDALSNQLDSMSETMDTFSNQLQTSIQKSVEESILRASLQAQNMGYKAQIEALIKQVDTLNSIIEGLQAQMGSIQQQQAISQASQNIAFAAGGDIVNEVVIVKSDPTSYPPESAIVGRINNGTGDYRWEFGQQLFITNNDLNPVTVTITVFNPSGQNWLSCPKNVFELTPGVSEELSLLLTPGGCTYTAGELSKTFLSNVRVAVKRRDGTEKARNLETKINIMHPDSY